MAGGALAGAGSVVYGLKVNTINFQMGYQNGLYAFTAAVLGGYAAYFASGRKINPVIGIAGVVGVLATHFPLLLLIGLGTRLSALGLLGMTLVIQVFVYPGAYATHGTWAALLLYLVSQGPGAFSVDHWIARRRMASR